MRAEISAVDPQHGRELWTSDGSSAGTHLVKDIVPGVASGISSEIGAYTTAVGGRVFFVASDPAHGAELWVSDGSDAGTHLVGHLPRPAGRHAGQSASPRVRRRLIFAANDGRTGSSCGARTEQAGSARQACARRIPELAV
jgi:ELWxxDGT repeat protein